MFGVRTPVGLTFSLPSQTGPEAHPASCTVGNGCPSRVLSRWAMALTTHPHLVPRFKSRSVPLLPIWAFMACYRANYLIHNFTFYKFHEVSRTSTLCTVNIRLHESALINLINNPRNFYITGKRQISGIINNTAKIIDKNIKQERPQFGLQKEQNNS